MSVIGIGLAFLMFWSIAGVGAYLALSSFNRLRYARLFNRMSLGNVKAVSSIESLMALINFLLLLLGLALVFEGFLFTYNVVFG